MDEDVKCFERALKGETFKWNLGQFCSLSGVSTLPRRKVWIAVRSDGSHCERLWMGSATGKTFSKFEF